LFVDEKRLADLLEQTLTGLGCELVDFDAPRRGGLLRVFIDHPGGVDVDRCAEVSDHLTRLFAVENVDYDRLEVSSPGLDRPLRKHADFSRFTGQRVHVKMRIPLHGRRNFMGILRAASDSQIQVEVDGATVTLDLSMMDKARLAPDFGGHR
jgi:ribosome maturation factor RimP